MGKIFIIFSLIIFSGIVFAKDPVLVKKTKKEKIIAKIDGEITTADFLNYLKEFMLKIDKGIKDGKPLSRTEYLKYSINLKNYVEYRWFIADTGLSRKWLKEIHKLVEYMKDTKGIIETETINGHKNTAKYKQAVKYFDVAYKRLIKLAEKPVKVSSKVKRKAKLNKVVWQKAMRKKYKIKDKPNMADF